jgi:hypothetical protein
VPELRCSVLCEQDPRDAENRLVLQSPQKAAPAQDGRLRSPFSAVPRPKEKRKLQRVKWGLLHVSVVA